MSDCYHCGGRGFIMNADEYDEQCPECAKRGRPDPLTRAERQVAAVREVLAECYRSKNECLEAGGSMAERAQAYAITAHRLTRALEVE